MALPPPRQTIDSMVRRHRCRRPRVCVRHGGRARRTAGSHRRASPRHQFLDGIEQFATPNNLIHTRRIVAPDFAARLRVDGRYRWQTYQRRTDGSYVGRRLIPRAKLESQVTRAIFLRVVAELDHTFQDDLRDDSRTNLPIAIRNADTGEYEQAFREEQRLLRMDALFSYQPTPGTVVFFGYGSTAAEPNDWRASALRRVRDGFFLKVSYLFRL